MRLHAAIVLALVVALAGCPASPPTDTPDAGDAPTPLTIDEWSDAELRLACDLFVCFFGIAPSESAAFCGDEPEKRIQRRAAVEAGRIAFDEAKARACIEVLTPLVDGCWGASADLSAWDAPLAGVCAEVLRGTVAAGSACFFDEECDRGYCDATAQACPGTCRPAVVENGACGGDRECAAGLDCVGSKCVRPVGEGGACSEALPCEARFTCDDDDRCVAPLDLGAACEPDGVPCGTGLFCSESGSTFVCAPRKATGAACTTGAAGLGIASPECLGNQVCRGLTLDDDGSVLLAGTCQPPSEVGGPCHPANGSPNVDEGGVGCFLGLRCDAGAKTCAKLPGPGEACFEDACDQTAFCDAGTCRALLADGEPCETSSECVNLCLGPANRCGPSPLAEQCLP